MESTNILISLFDVWSAVICGVLVLLLAIFFQKGRIGRALRAVADDHQAAMSVGIPLQMIWAIVWAVAGMVALVAGALWGQRLGVQFSISLVALKALPVLILYSPFFIYTRYSRFPDSSNFAAEGGLWRELFVFIDL